MGPSPLPPFIFVRFSMTPPPQQTWKCLTTVDEVATKAMLSLATIANIDFHNGLGDNSFRSKCSVNFQCRIQHRATGVCFFFRICRLCCISWFLFLRKFLWINRAMVSAGCENCRYETPGPSINMLTKVSRWIGIEFTCSTFLLSFVVMATQFL